MYKVSETSNEFWALKNKSLYLMVTTRLNYKVKSDEKYIRWKSTLIQFYENGEIAVLYDNKKLSKNTTYTFPDKENFNGIEAYLEDGFHKTKDLTIIISCKNKKDFSYFDFMSNEKENFAKVYGKVFDTMDGCDAASRALSIRRW